MLAWPGAFPRGIVLEMVSHGVVPAEGATDGRAHALVNGPRRRQREVATKLVTALARGQRRLVTLVDAVAARIRAGAAEPPPAAATPVRLPPADCPEQWDHDCLAENEPFLNGEPPVSVARVQALRDRWPAWSTTLNEAGIHLGDGLVVRDGAAVFKRAMREVFVPRRAADAGAARVDDRKNDRFLISRLGIV